MARVHLEHDPAIHKPSLQEANSQESRKPRQGGVEVASCEIQHLKAIIFDYVLIVGRV